jgi:hypothetical protein
VALAAFADDGLGLGVGEVLDALLVCRWNFTQTRSLAALIMLKVWLPKPCMWR